MPTYVYKREDGSTFEIEQRITAPALDTCPTTGQAVRRIPSAGAGLVFKGSGFYLTDYVRKGEGGEAGKAAKADAAKADAAKPEAGKSDAAKAPEASPSVPGAGNAGASTPGTPGAT
jgi:predicted nucleic acid-binding Zn ribbon protein